MRTKLHQSVGAPLASTQRESAVFTEQNNCTLLVAYANKNMAKQEESKSDKARQTETKEERKTRKAEANKSKQNKATRNKNAIIRCKCQRGVLQDGHIGDSSKERDRTEKREHRRRTSRTGRRDRRANIPSGKNSARLTLERAVAESERKGVKRRPYYILCKSSV